MPWDHEQIPKRAVNSEDAFGMIDRFKSAYLSLSLASRLV